MKKIGVCLFFLVCVGSVFGAGNLEGEVRHRGSKFDMRWATNIAGVTTKGTLVIEAGSYGEDKLWKQGYDPLIEVDKDDIATFLEGLNKIQNLAQKDMSFVEQGRIESINFDSYKAIAFDSVSFLHYFIEYDIVKQIGMRAKPTVKALVKKNGSGKNLLKVYINLYNPIVNISYDWDLTPDDDNGDKSLSYFNKLMNILKPSSIQAADNRPDVGFSLGKIDYRLEQGGYIRHRKGEIFASSDGKKIFFQVNDDDLWFVIDKTQIPAFRTAIKSADKKAEEWKILAYKNDTDPFFKEMPIPFPTGELWWIDTYGSMHKKTYTPKPTFQVSENYEFRYGWYILIFDLRTDYKAGWYMNYYEGEIDDILKYISDYNLESKIRIKLSQDKIDDVFK